MKDYEIFKDIREDHYVKYKDKIEALPAPWYYFWTCHLSVLRKDVLEVGLFDEMYDGRWGVEDNDLGFRLHQHGVKIFLLRCANAIHFPHGKNKRDRQLEGYENCKYFDSKHNTIETKIFLQYYTDASSASLKDINEISSLNSSELALLKI